MLELNPHTAAAYLGERGAIDVGERVEIRELSGGVSNTVLLVHRPDSPGRDFVLKQALPRLKVQQEWLCSIERIWWEVEVLEICGQLLASEGHQPPDPSIVNSWATVIPQVLFSDRPNYCYAMTAAPAGHQTWKERLLAGEIDTAIATACGRLLGTLHAESWQQPVLAERLADRTFFDSLRLDPYYRRLMVVHPDLTETLNQLVADTYATRQSLVHGDFSPKNLLIAGREIWLIDFEVGHFGDPAFDLGFFLTHLALKSVHFRARRDEYLGLVTAFWKSYETTLATGVDEAQVRELSRRSALHWSACLLARVDGKSPADYLSPAEQDAVRQVARSLMLHPAGGVPEMRDRLAE